MMRRFIFRVYASLKQIRCGGSKWLFMVFILLLLMTSLLQVRAQMHRDVFTLRLGSGSFAWVESVRSGIQFVLLKNVSPELSFRQGWCDTKPADPLPGTLTWGFGYFVGRSPILLYDGFHRYTAKYWVIVVPWWALFLLEMVVPLFLVRAGKKDQNKNGVAYMKYFFIAIGVLLIGIPVLVDWFKKATDHVDLDPGQVVMHIGKQPQQLFPNVPWTGYRLTADNRTYPVYVREYPEPILLGKAMEGFKPSMDNKKSALGLMSLSFYLGCKGSLKEQADLFDNPAEAMNYEWLSKDQGGMDMAEAADKLRRDAKRAVDTEQLLGEAIIGDCYVYVHKRPDWLPMFYTYVRESNGTYRIPLAIPKRIAPVLNGHHLLKLFPKYKDVWEKYFKERIEQLSREKGS